MADRQDAETLVSGSVRRFSAKEVCREATTSSGQHASGSLPEAVSEVVRCFPALFGALQHV
eukprot:14116900-Alexandrium_andersonii.AAC.1